MEDLNISDYKFDGRFLKEIMFEILEKPRAQEFTTRLPVLVQVVKMIKAKRPAIVQTAGEAVKYDEWTLYYLADGELEMSRCVFVSKQARPEGFSILKIKKITKLSQDMRNKFKDFYTVGEIEFDTEVNGDQIGHCLYKDLKDIDMEELMERKKKIGCARVKKIMELPKAMEIMKHMWENRSEKFCDINFTFNEGVVFAHRSVLAAASEVFKAHTDNDGFNDNKSVNIVDVSLYSFVKLLEFIYMDKVQFTTWRLAFELLYLSKKYLMPDLEQICQSVIDEFCDYDGENVLQVFEQNRRVNDTFIQRNVKDNVVSKIYEIINSKSYLNCEFSTVEWIMSQNLLPLDEWSRLCAIYKWAIHNEVNAFCERSEHEMGEPRDCLHGLLEYVHFEKIDGLSLQRFLKLSKLHEVVNVSELKLCVFESLLEDGSLCSHNGTNYSKYRSLNTVHAEIEIGNSKEMKMKDIVINNDGPVLSFKIKIEEEKLANGELSLDIVPSFRYLYSRDEKKTVKLYFSVRTIKTKSRSVSSEDIACVAGSANLNQGEWKELRLHLKDCRGYFSDRIENFGVYSGDADRLKVISLDIFITEIMFEEIEVSYDSE